MSDGRMPPVPSHLLKIVDVGSAGGIQDEWLDVAQLVAPVLFEPNGQEAAKLRASVQTLFPNATVLETALSNMVERRNLNLTQYWGCSSLLAPNLDFLSQYRIAPAFNVISGSSVECRPYHDLFSQGLVPQPDAIKVDVQGFEFQVLVGFGSLLQRCLAIKVESHFYPVYHNQHLLHHLIDYLRGFGFVLRRLEPSSNFDGDLVEVDAWFTKCRIAWLDFDAETRRKFDLICRKWHLLNYDRVDSEMPHDAYRPV